MAKPIQYSPSEPGETHRTNTPTAENWEDEHHGPTGAVKIAHGGCLAAAHLFAGAAFPL